jgi:hypothetical protein
LSRPDTGADPYRAIGNLCLDRLRRSNGCMAVQVPC